MLTKTIKESNENTYLKKSLYNCGSTKRLYGESELNRYNDDEIICVSEPVMKNEIVEIYNLSTYENNLIKKLKLKNNYSDSIHYNYMNHFKNYELTEEFLNAIYASNEVESEKIREGVEIKVDNKNKYWRRRELNLKVKIPVVAQEVIRKKKKNEDFETKEIIKSYPVFKKKSIFDWFNGGRNNRSHATVLKAKNDKNERNSFNLENIKYINEKEFNIAKIGFFISRGKEFCKKMKIFHDHDESVERIPTFENYERFKFSYTREERKNIFSFIDFRRNVKIDKIGLMGKRYHIIYCNKDYTYFLKENENCWITKFKIYIRGDGERAWHELGIFNGNNNRYEEILINLEREINCRYIKVQVLSFVGNPEYQIAFYKKGKSDETNICLFNEYEVSLTMKTKFADTWRQLSPVWKAGGRAFKYSSAEIRNNIKKNIKADTQELL